MIHGFNDPYETEQREAKEERRERRDTLIERFVPPEHQLWDYTQKGQGDVVTSVSKD